jgi:hypothetical protein
MKKLKRFRERAQELVKIETGMCLFKDSWKVVIHSIEKKRLQQIRMANVEAPLENNFKPLE